MMTIDQMTLWSGELKTDNEMNKLINTTLLEQFQNLIEKLSRQSQQIDTANTHIHDLSLF